MHQHRYDNSRDMRTENDEPVKGTSFGLSQFIGTSKELDVHRVPSVPDPDYELCYRDCVLLPESPKSGVQICVHPSAEDRGVSRALKSNRLWERNVLFEMNDALKNDSSLMLFDVGCNIGQYTLWAAAMGRDVVAVEMLPVNVHMVQTALQLSGLDKSVTLVKNAVYKEHKELNIRFLHNTIGATRLNVTKYVKRKLIDKPMTAQAICIDDLIPLMKGRNVYMKMDIEDSEHTALMGAERFFEEVNVKIVQMEWHRRVPEEANPILDFMRRHKFVSSLKPNPYTPIDLATNKRNLDVFFLKKSAHNRE